MGEALGLLASRAPGPLRSASSLQLSVAGSEFNVAIGASRLGTSSAWCGRVGDDELGKLVESTLRAERVDVSGLLRDPGTTTSLMLREQRTSQITRVTYYRKEGPGSRLCPEDLDESLIRNARILLVSGITPALSTSAAETIDAAIAIAQSAGAQIAVAVNYRSALWEAERAADVLRRLVAQSDIVFATREEAAMLTGADEPGTLAAKLFALGPAAALVTKSADGAEGCIDGKHYRQTAIPIACVNPIGAGDGFAAGFLSEWLSGVEPPGCLATACACGAFAVASAGDWEGLPSRVDLALLSANSHLVIR